MIAQVLVLLLAAAPAAAFLPGQALRPRAVLWSSLSLRPPPAPPRAAGATIVAQVDKLQTAGPVSRPEVGSVRADDLIRWLWNEVRRYPAPCSNCLDSSRARTALSRWVAHSRAQLARADSCLPDPGKSGAANQ